MAKFKFSSFNKERRFNFDVTPIVGKYVKASELGDLMSKNGENYVYIIRGLYLGTLPAEASRTGKEQKTASIATDFSYINVPAFQYEEVADMINNQQAVDYINSGCAGFKIVPYETRGEEYYKIVWVDIESGDTVD